MEENRKWNIWLKKQKRKKFKDKNKKSKWLAVSMPNGVTSDICKVQLRCVAHVKQLSLYIN